MIEQLRVGGADDASTSVPGSSTRTACTRSAVEPRIGAPTTAESRTPGMLVQHALDVLGKDVEPLGRDDHFLLAAADVQRPAGVELADVAGVEPAVR